jgi:IS30 family transposase
VKPILSKGWNHRGQIDLMDLQSTPDGEYKWLMNYQDHLTKFIHLRPLKSKRAEEVSSELLKKILQFGAPKILQSDNGREFVNSVINQLISRWPSCKIVNGRPRHPQSQGSVERSNQDVENMLRA